MTIGVKICGLTTTATMATALNAGADYVGLVFYPNSPRHLSIADATVLSLQATVRAAVVALTVDADDAYLDQIIAEVKPDVIQMHGHESPERVAAVRARTGKSVIKAIAVANAADATRALAYRGVADLILFDAKAPTGALLPGGNGVAFDWHALDGIKNLVPWMLSGGLTPESVADAIRLTGATIVDVSSGVESSLGIKDPHRIEQFIQAAKRAAPLHVL